MSRSIEIIVNGTGEPSRALFRIIDPSPIDTIQKESLSCAGVIGSRHAINGALRDLRLLYKEDSLLQEVK